MNDFINRRTARIAVLYVLFGSFLLGAVAGVSSKHHCKLKGLDVMTLVAIWPIHLAAAIGWGLTNPPPMRDCEVKP